jgi:hypothetical protein
MLTLLYKPYSQQRLQQAIKQKADCSCSRLLLYPILNTWTQLKLFPVLVVSTCPARHAWRFRRGAGVACGFAKRPF